MDTYDHLPSFLELLNYLKQIDNDLYNAEYYRGKLIQTASRRDWNRNKITSGKKLNVFVLNFGLKSKPAGARKNHKKIL